ncbi:hypothetical protein HFN60_30200 [Rhizobium leguminosarum]|uniref:hypothetical protein n=1 Tax=Rhizobium leguminosarum TaxID=384 RepID=UPI001C9877FE|nr:hypothetical protein [Rhizobium leguminosarum]MBY5819866.1 hypothetical protein [Rhizobium leguminosarum]
MIEIKQGHLMLLPALISMTSNLPKFLRYVNPRTKDVDLTIKHMRRCCDEVMSQARQAARFDPEVRIEGTRLRYWVAKEHTRACRMNEAMFLWTYLEFRKDEWGVVNAEHELTRIEPGYGERFEFLNYGRREENVY